MPPKAKRQRSHRCANGDCGTSCNTNPRVILRPFLADRISQRRSHFSAVHPCTSLFNKAENSDIRLKVGTEYFFAHKLILSAGSEIFAKMLSSDWAEGEKSELELQEEGECAKVFHLFLYYFYSGSISISDSVVIPLFMLADKYNVKPVYDECERLIEAGLKVYIVESNTRREEKRCEDSQSSHSSSSTDSSTSSDSSETCDFDSSDDEEPSQSIPHPIPSAGTSIAVDSVPSTSMPSDASGSASHSKSTAKVRLVGSEIFPVSLVVKMLKFWHNKRISTAALYNLEARLGNQISQENYCMWNGLQADLIVQMLQDANFCYSEFLLFKAAQSWLLANGAPNHNADSIPLILNNIRYPLLSIEELYQVERSSLVKVTPSTVSLVQDAMRYHLFHTCCNAEDRAKWSGYQFECRRPRQ